MDAQRSLVIQNLALAWRYSVGDRYHTKLSTPEAIDAYLDKGPDFIKYGGTAHFARPAFIGFSPEAQKVIVEAAHKRNRGA